MNVEKFQINNPFLYLLQNEKIALYLDDLFHKRRSEWFHLTNNNSVATKKYIEELRHELLGTLATKEEIKKLATKGKLSLEIGLLATKIDEQEINRQK